jgi:outer membrane protein assembly factor BamB
MISAGGNPTNLAIYANVPITPRPTGSNTWNGTGYSARASNATYAAVTAPSYDQNMTFPIQFTTTPTIRAAKVNDILWGSNGSWPTGTSGPNYAYPDEVTVWAVSLKPESYGQLIYMKNIDVDDATRNTNIMFERATADERIFVALEVPNCRFIGYDMNTGNKLWETDSQSDTSAYGYFTWPSLISATQTKMAYGLLFTGGYTGYVSAYNLTNGNLVWRNTYPSGGLKIPNYVQMLALICDGKIYVGTHEHSADTPLYKGERIHCLDVYTGEEIWSMAGWAYPMTFATADGVLIFWNNYDAQVYAVGKGPTSTTVEAPMAGVTLGSSLVIRGTVTDISAGTKQKEQAARFPNGVAAVSETSMSSWMEYVYMQKMFPADCKGVDVTISVLDANGNYRDIGTAASDASGTFTLAWTPDIPGKYTVVARFAGSESYYGSYAESAFVVDPAPPAEAEPPAEQPSLADQYLLPATGGIIASVAIVGVILALVLRKRP